MDNLTGRDGHAGFILPRQIITGQFVINAAIRCDQNLDVPGVQHIQGRDNASLIALLENVGVPMDQFAFHPISKELDAVLVCVRLAQNRAVGRVILLDPDAIRGQFDHANRHLGNIACDQRHAARDSGECHHAVQLDFLVHLPSARERLLHPAPEPTRADLLRLHALAGDGEAENAHDQSSAFMSLRR